MFPGKGPPPTFAHLMTEQQMQLAAMSTDRMAGMADILQNRSMPDITCHLSDVRGPDAADKQQHTRHVFCSLR